MKQPGLQPGGQPDKEDEAPGIAKAGGKKKSGLTKILAAAALAGLGFYGLSKCDGDQGTQTPSGSSAINAPPVTADGLYYIVRSESPLRSTPDQDHPIANRFVQPGSCAEGVKAADGQQSRTNLYYRVRLTEENGRVSEGFLHMGQLAVAQPAQLAQGCIATFKNSTTPVPAQPTIAPTFTNVTTINLRDAADLDAPPWATLAANSCVLWTGDQQAGMMQVGIITAQSAPHPVDYKWVRAQDIARASVPAERCISNYTVGASAGITPNPWK